MLSNIVLLRESFSTFGLNRYRDFLEDYDYFYADSDEELAEVMAGMIEENGCAESALFAVGYNNRCMYVAITDAEYDEESENLQMTISVARHEFDMDLFAEMDGDLRLCCYGIITEIEPGKWKVLHG